jgi:hypothetical protein
METTLELERQGAKNNDDRRADEGGFSFLQTILPSADGQKKVVKKQGEVPKEAGGSGRACQRTRYIEGFEGERR